MSVPFGILFALLLAALSGCGGDDARGAYEQQLQVCSVAEGNGLLDDAVRACGAALAIADGNGYDADVVASLLYRVGRLERQRGNFVTAESHLRRAQAMAEAAGDTRAVTVRMVELAQILAGQDLWLDGFQLLDRAAPLLHALDAEERRAARNVFRGFSIRLGMLGHSAEAERCEAVAAELTAAP